MNKKLSYISLLLSFTLLLASCGNDFASDGSQHSQRNSGGSGVSSSHSMIRILDDTGQTLGSIDNGSITYNGVALRSKVGSSGKLKYMGSDGQLIAKIKRSSSEKFKLKSNSGDLLWKVKLKESSIKIANNEEMSGAYKIKLKDPGRTKLLLDEQQFGEARMEGESVVVKGLNASYKVQGGDVGVVSVVGLDKIPMEMRLVIMNELLK